MSFFVSKDIEGRLDEETFATKDSAGESVKQSCRVEIDFDDRTLLFKIKKLNFSNEEENKYLVQLSLHADDICRILSNTATIQSIKLSSYTIDVSRAMIKQIEESNKIDEYLVDITCYSA